MKLRYITLLMSCFLYISLSAQNSTVRGNVYEKETGNPIIYGTVHIQGTKHTAMTDLDGFFNMANIPAGSYKLIANYVGYDSAVVDIQVKKNGVVYQALYINESSVSLKEVSVSAEKQHTRTNVNISQIAVTQKQIKALPSVGGEADIVQYLQVLPGIISTGDQGGQIYIRGGSPVQNKIMLDGLNVFNPFHSIGFYSVFETELIRNVDVLTGGFGADHGGRISAIVDIKTREGNKNRQSGQLSVGPFMVKGLLEGPLKKFSEGGSSVSYVLTAKKSLIENTSKSLYAYATEDKETGLPFGFTDLYGKISVNTSNGSRINVFGFNFNDLYDNPAISTIDWKNTGGGINFHMIPSESNIIVDGVVGFSTYEVGIKEQDTQPRKSDIDELTANIGFTFYGDKNEVKYGLELKSIRTNFEFTNPFGIRFADEQNTTELGFYSKYRHIIGSLIVDPSIRVQYYSALGQVALEPRIGIKYNINDVWRFKGAAGRYTQNILSTSNERDVVNLFNGFLTGPESIIKDYNGQKLDNKLQISNHVVAGFEFDLTKRMTLNLEGYYKNFPQLIVVNRNKENNDETDYTTETGSAYGVDMSIKYELPRFYVWATYSHGYVNRDDGEQIYPTIFDRRHNVNFLTTYSLDKEATWEVSARWNLGSGFPFTKTRGFYNYQSYLGGVTTPYETNNPHDIGIIYSSERNGGRLPYYHRLDLSLQKKIKFTKYSGMEANLSVTNAYDRPNIFYFDRLNYKRVNQLPILPTLSVKFYF
ncbi:MAG TPA: TonB-dependent receptor [Saprospiraceae bacterium]|nr:TonB-dependent receptor [Saprospiraceae bacterium]HRO08764.1 TonB-dependent receptor [Saprospiraceae bacterium]HRP41629.1 TonB-dependent receptor [Saprospiraceae bacterium]